MRKCWLLLLLLLPVAFCIATVLVLLDSSSSGSSSDAPSSASVGVTSTPLDHAVGVQGHAGRRHTAQPIDRATVGWYKETNRAHSVVLPGPRVLDDSPAGHCPLAKGSWCGPYWTQLLLPPRAPPHGNATCHNDCNGVGTCNADTGVCACSAGWRGDDCSVRAPRPCFNMGADKRDRNLTAGGWLHTRCSGVCDDDIGMCYCPPETVYGRRTDPRDPRGLYPGRPMYWCQPNTTADGLKVPWSWNSHTYQDVLGPQGWCNANTTTRPCGCTLDGYAGQWCEHRVEQFCPNQCGGHGTCQLGFCRCHAGWYGHDCVYRRAGAHEDPGPIPPHLMQVTRRVPAAADPPTRPFRKRPFVYVYELPPKFNALMLQRRLEGHACINRFFGERNVPQFVGYNAYALDTVWHEALLTSEHRTLDPDEADFFYVPAYISCLADVVGKNDLPIWPEDNAGAGVWGDRPYRMSMMALDAKRWVQHHLPYWNRTGGRDHIWLLTHDEAPCYAHEELWPSIILSHWGRLDFPHGSNSSYHADNYSREATHPELLPRGWLAHSSRAHPCHDPVNHLVVPVFKPPQHYRHSPFLGAPRQHRDILAFFRGDMGLNREGCVYSRCIRQTLWRLCKEQQWKARHNVWYGDHAETPGDYSQLLARSKFCLVIPGDGWSARYEDAMTHGCVPVIIMDNTLGPFEALIDYSQFSIRVPESQLSRLVELLTAVTPQRLAALQAGVAQAWMRFRWNSVPLVEPYVLQALVDNVGDAAGLPGTPGIEWAQTGDDDAFSTVMQWLYSRLPSNAPRQHSGPGAGSATATA